MNKEALSAAIDKYMGMSEAELLQAIFAATEDERLNGPPADEEESRAALSELMADIQNPALLAKHA